MKDNFKFKILSFKSVFNEIKHLKLFHLFKIYKLKFKIVLAIFFCLFAANTASASTISRPMSNSGLVGYWSMDEGTGDKTFDRSGNGKTGTITNMDNADWVNSNTGLGQTLDFTSAGSEYVRVPDSSNLEGFSAVTFSAWVNPTSLPDSNGNILVAKPTTDGAGTSDPYQLWGATVLTDGTMWFALSTGVAGSRVILNPTSPTVSTGGWSFLTYTWDGTTMRVYKNGVVSATTAAFSGPVGTNSIDVRIGAFISQGVDGYWNGKLDEVRIYNRALSVAEINRLYNLKKEKVASGINNTGLVGYWAFEEGVGTRAEDSSFNTNTGTLSGMASPPTSTSGWGAGRLGGGLNFDGANDKVTTNFTTQLNNFTACVWFKSSSNSASSRIVDKLYDSGFWLGHETSGAANQWGGGVLEGGPPYGIFVALVNGSWHHICSVRSGTTHTIYGDGGATVASNTVSATALNTSALSIGAVSNGNSPFSGKIDEVRVYSRALSATEVYNLYKGSKATVVNKTNKNRVTNGLVGYWTFDGKDIYSTTAIDRSGSGNNGTLTNGPVVTLGKIGQALKFDGGNDNVNVGDQTAIDLTETVSVSAWVNLDTVAVNQRIVSKWGAAGNQQYILSTDDATSNKFSFATRVSGSPNYEICDSTSTYSTGQWVHVVGSYDGTNCFIYTNGVNVTNRTDDASGNMPNTATSLRFGIEGDDGASLPLNGKIDEVRIYNRALSADEIYQLYNMGR